MGTETKVMGLSLPEDQLKLAGEYIEGGQVAMEDDENYIQAISMFLEALKIQHHVLGKHDFKVGCTCSHIATAYWLQSNKSSLTYALKYFLEARRIYCKTGKGKINGIGGIDQKIHSILKQMGLTSMEIEQCEKEIEHVIYHELQADYFKTNGQLDLSKHERIKSRQSYTTLIKLVAA